MRPVFFPPVLEDRIPFRFFFSKEKFVTPFVPPILVKHKSTLGTTLNTINIRYKTKKR